MKAGSKESREAKKKEREIKAKRYGKAERYSWQKGSGCNYVKEQFEADCPSS
jgi:hypothetical protein